MVKTNLCYCISAVKGIINLKIQCILCKDLILDLASSTLFIPLFSFILLIYYHNTCISGSGSAEPLGQSYHGGVAYYCAILTVAPTGIF